MQVAQDGDAGLVMAMHNAFDLVILDVMLPVRSGWSLVEALQKDRLTPVLLLTARDTVPDRVKGLELGADDYLVKPFAFSELLARVRGLLRRTPCGPRSTLGGRTWNWTCSGATPPHRPEFLGLTRQEFLLLSLLVRKRGEVLSRAFIAEQVWDMRFDTDTNAVDVAVRRLRRKVDDPFRTSSSTRPAPWDTMSTPERWAPPAASACDWPWPSPWAAWGPWWRSSGSPSGPSSGRCIPRPAPA